MNMPQKFLLPIGAVMSSLCFLSTLLIVAHISALEFRYHSNREIENFLLQVHSLSSVLVSLTHDITSSHAGVSSLTHVPPAGDAKVEERAAVLGRVLMLQLIDDLIRGYRNNETWFNQNGVDLNRNFPDAFTHLSQKPPLDERKLEAEVQAVIGWLRNETFVLSANLHGGALVASYPYDNSNGGSEWVGGASVSPDDDVFVHLAKVYSYNHASMHRGDGCGDSRPFLHGITNGYQWYPLPGGMQDYNYVWAQCLELTLEISCCKFPPVNQLPALWSANREALLAFIRQVHLGVKGQVFDSSGVPVQNAVVEVKGRNNMSPFRSDKHGEYYRLLLPGNYSFTVTLPGHETLTQTISIPPGPDRYSAVKHDFRLQRVSATTPPDFGATATSSLHLSGSSGAGPTWTGLGVGLVVALRSLIG
ncbi:hypothetical protein fugu_019899 [Takifugu bimaculatus]|uniref:Peptidase M14 domain-containing protein n=1 Tax=Takifugu bimaculatus TaxID=433685 RepID=A0A4Z2BHP3_9TELE|nr:hypothetical protein fugu_019899 [Takifugu bimaculatus]